MTWYAYHDTAGGRLLSCGSDGAPAPDGVTRITLTGQPGAAEMWDEATRAFVARPAKVLVDRLTDLDNDPELSAVWTRLTAAQRTTLRNRLARLLGAKRWRHPSGTVDLP